MVSGELGMEFRYLYRGTTKGWPGNETLQAERITCTTTDPFVAALFGVECRNHGYAVILMARADAFSDLVGPPNHFAGIESAVNLLISPDDFSQRVERILEVDEVLSVLRELGFDRMSIRLRDRWALREALFASYQAGERLNEEQLLHFVIRILGARP
jgi:hypothetical protein